MDCKNGHVPLSAHEASTGAPDSTNRRRFGHEKIIGKLRLDRGPLRWWLIVAGMLMARFDVARFAVGAPFVVAGAALHLISKGYLSLAKEKRRVLTTAGPYRFTRNPFYLGNLVAEVGILVIIGRPWLAVAYVLAWICVYHRQVTAEEAWLGRLLGQEYVRYCERVPRFLPLPWRFLSRTEAQGSFSWSNSHISRGSELERALRLLSYPLLLACVCAARHQIVWHAVDPSVVAVIAGVGFIFLNALGRFTSWLAFRRKKERLRAIKHGLLARYAAFFSASRSM